MSNREEEPERREGLGSRVRRFVDSELSRVMNKEEPEEREESATPYATRSGQPVHPATTAPVDSEYDSPDYDRPTSDRATSDHVRTSGRVPTADRVPTSGRATTSGRVPVSDRAVIPPDADLPVSEPKVTVSEPGVTKSDTGVTTSDTGVTRSDTGVTTSDTGVSTSHSGVEEARGGQVSGRSSDEVAADGSAERIGLLNDPAGLRDQWQEVQGTFVDDPHRAVQEASALVDRTLREIHQNVSRGQASDPTSTEDLRVSFQRYREFFQRLLSA